MPRRREPDAEDMMVRCPRCKGNTVVYDLTAETEVACPVCAGVGRVTPLVYQAYIAGTLTATSPSSPSGS